MYTHIYIYTYQYTDDTPYSTTPKYLIAPTSHDVIQTTGWVREGMSGHNGVEMGVGETSAGGGSVGAGARKGRVVVAQKEGEGVVVWEEMRLEEVCTEGGVFVVHRNGDSSGTCVCVCVCVCEYIYIYMYIYICIYICIYI